MSGFKGLSRLPRDTVRARRNASRLATDADALLEAPLFVGGDGIIRLDIGDGLTVSSGELAVDVAASNPGLQFVAGDLAAKVKVTGGILVGSDGFYADVTVLVPYTGATASVNLGAYGLTAEQVTSTDDITMAGSLLNTMAAGDTVGVYVDGATNPYTGTSTNYGVRNNRTIGGTGGSSFTSYAAYNNITNGYANTSNGDLNTYGAYNAATRNGSIGGVGSPLFKPDEGLYGTYSKAYLSGTVTNSFASLENYGVSATATTQISYNSSGGTLTMETYGGNFRVHPNYNVTAGTIVGKNYGFYAACGIAPSGNSTNYGVYISVESASTATWGLYNGSVALAHNFFGGDSIKNYRGSAQDVSDYFDGSHWYFNSANVTANDEIRFTNFSHYRFDNAIDVTGITSLGDGGTTNYARVSASGDLTFHGSAGFYPRKLTQADVPAAGTGATECDTGELVVWKDSDDSKVYLCFNDAGTVKKVELV